MGQCKSLKTVSIIAYLLGVMALTSCNTQNLVIKFKKSEAISGSVLAANLNATSAANQNSLSNKSQNFAAFSLDSINAFFCTQATAHLYKLDSDGSLVKPQLAVVNVDNSGKYKFNERVNVLESSFQVVIEGCNQSLSRVITGYGNQDISAGTTLLSWMTQSSQYRQKMLSQSSKLNLLFQGLEKNNSYSEAYSSLTSNPSLETLFVQVFGTEPDVLTQVAPRDGEINFPLEVSEGQPANFSVTTAHWLPSYNIAYVWKLDNEVISTSATGSFIPTANSQGVHTVSVYYGQSSGLGLDTSKPIRSKSFKININDLFPAAPPTLALVGAAYTQTPQIVLRMNTGASRMNCKTFSKLALSEDSLFPPLVEADYNIQCSQNGTQDIPFTLTGGEGLRTVYLWARDASGNISQSASSITVTYDSTQPTISVNSPVSLSSVKGSVNISGICEPGPNVVITGNVTNTFTTTCNVGLFSTRIDLSNGEGSKTISISQTDLAGNVGTSQLIVTRDETPPVVSFLTPIADKSTQRYLTVTGTCGNLAQDLTSIFISSSDIVGSPIVATCASGSFTQVIELTGADGAKNVSIIQKDSADNSGVVYRNFIKDTTAPQLSISSPPANQLSRSSLVVNGICENGTVVISGDIVGSTINATCSGLNFSVPITLAGADGSKTITVQQVDDAGNAGQVTRTFIKDTSAPLLSITGPPSNSRWQSTVTITGTCESGGTLDFSGSIAAVSTLNCNGGTFSQAVVLQGSDGSKSVTVTHTNTLGNVVTLSRSFIRDTSAPLALLSSPFSLQESRGSFVITGICGTLVGDLQTLVLSSPNLQDSPVTANCTSGSFSQPILLNGSDGVSHITITQSDDASNTTTLDLALVKDTQAPTLSISSPAPLYQTQSTLTLTGTCETGLPVSITGGLIASPVSTNCVSSNFSQSLSLSAPDETKSIQISQTDNSGNSASVTRNFVRDNVAPVVAFTSPGSSTSAQNSLNITGTCEPGLDVEFTGTGLSASFTRNCATGTFSESVTFSAADGTKEIIATQRDSSGNLGSISRTFIKDNQSPAISISAPTVNFSTQNSISISGTCEAGLPLLISGSITGSPVTSSCASGNFSESLILTGVDGTKTITVSQTDDAGNSSSTTRNFIKDTTAPLITIATPSSGAFFQSGLSVSGSCESGLSVSITVDSVTTSSTCVSSVFSKSIVVSTADGSKTMTVSQTDAAGNTGNASLAIVKDNSPPILASVNLNNGDSFVGTPFVSVYIQGSDSLSTTLLMKAKEADGSGNCNTVFTDDNWSAYSSTNPLNLLISSTDGVKKVCAWLKDQAGNLSVMSDPQGSIGVNMDTIQFLVGNPPKIVLFSAVNNTAGANLGTTTFTAGDQVKIDFNLTDSEGLDNNPLNLYYTTNNINWISLVANYGGLSGNPTSYSGSYLTFNAPTSSFFRIKAIAKDSSGNTSIPVMSDVLNSGGFSVYAGTTGNGVGGSATTVLVNSSIGSNNRFAFHPKTGDLYTVDSGFGIMKLDVKTGITSYFMVHGNFGSSTSGTIAPSTGINSTLTSLLFDRAGYLYIKSLDNYAAGAKVIRVNTQTGAFTQVLGGGSDITNSATPTTVSVHTGGMAFDEDESLYFYANCSPGTATGTTGTIRLMKAVNNLDGTFGAISVIAGNCVRGSPPTGGPNNPLTSPITNTSYPEYTSIIPFNRGASIYFQTNGQFIKILNGQLYASAINVGGAAYNSTDGSLYTTTNSTVYKCTPNLTSANGETCTIFVNKSGTGNCLADGIDKASACSLAGQNPVFASDGTLFYVEGSNQGLYRIRYIDKQNKIRTFLGSLPFYGDTLSKTVIRGAIKGIYYKKSSELNQTAFPEGLYFVDSGAPSFGYIDPTTYQTRLLWGNQSGSGNTASGTTIDSSVSMGQRYVGGDGYSLNFDSNGLPWLRYNNILARLDSNKALVNLQSSSTSTMWHLAPANSNPNLYGSYVYGSYQNLVLKNSGAFFIGGYNLPGDATYGNTVASIKYFDFGGSLVTNVLAGATNAASADITTAGQASSATLPTTCLNSGICAVNYRSDQDRLYFSEGLKLRYVTTPTNAATSTLITLFSVTGASIENFTFRPDNTQLFYIRSGKIYCHDISSGKAWCNDTILGPNSPLNGIAYAPNQLTWKDNNTLFISTGGGEIYKYTLLP